MKHNIKNKKLNRTIKIGVIKTKRASKGIIFQKEKLENLNTLKYIQFDLTIAKI